MLKHTQEIKKLYEEIQKQIYYMIPENGIVCIYMHQ